MTMTKEAIQYLTELGIRPEARLIEKDNRLFSIDSQGDVTEIQHRVYHSHDELTINTLSGFVNYVKSNLDRASEKLIVHVKNEQNVMLKGILDIDGSREVLARAAAIVPRFSFDNFYDMEEFNIALQSKFVDLRADGKPDDRAILLQVVGNVQEENVKNTGDNGVSQAVTIKQGVNSADVLVPNPVELAPYRTFLEVDQPVSKFIFRMKDGPRAAIFEADGGAWRNQAIVNIREFLVEALAEEIDSGRITLIA